MTFIGFTHTHAHLFLVDVYTSRTAYGNTRHGRSWRCGLLVATWKGISYLQKEKVCDRDTTQVFQAVQVYQFHS